MKDDPRPLKSHSQVVKYWRFWVGGSTNTDTLGHQCDRKFRHSAMKLHIVSGRQESIKERSKSLLAKSDKASWGEHPRSSAFCHVEGLGSFSRIENMPHKSCKWRRRGGRGEHFSEKLHLLGEIMNTMAISFCSTFLSSLTESLSWTYNGRFLWSMCSAAGSTCSIGRRRGTTNANGVGHTVDGKPSASCVRQWPLINRRYRSFNSSSAVNATVMNEERPYSVLDDVASELSHLSTKTFCCAVILPVDYLYSLLRVSLNPPGVHSRWRLAPSQTTNRESHAASSLPLK